MRRPLVSVMIPVFNGASYLPDAVDSVLAQSYHPMEVIVVDDGSTDGTSDVAHRYSEDLLLVRQENAGNGAARNRAVECASGELFAFLDADDRFTPDKLELQWQVLAKREDVDVVFGHVREFVSPELTARERQSIRPPAPPTPWPAPNLMLVRRAAFFEVGLFDVSLKVGVTVDWYARAMEQGLRSWMLPDVVLERRLHLSNNGLRESASRAQYLHVIKASLDRRRAAAADRARS